MRRTPRLALALAVIAASAPVAGAAEWPADRQFPLVEVPHPLGLYPPPSSIAEEADGSLLVLLYWPVVKEEEGSTSEWSRTRLVRIAPDGSRFFVAPFGRLEPGSTERRINVEDEVLPLPDGSILFTRYNAIDRRRPNGSIVRFAGTGRYNEGSSGDGGPATKADIGFAHGLSRLPDGSIVFADGPRIRRVAPDGTITTIAGSGLNGFGGDGGPAAEARLAGPSDVLPTADGGILIADTYNGRVRRVAPDGTISTIAGVGNEDIFESSGDGGPATAAALALPRHVGVLPDGSLLVGEWERIRRVAPDGTIETIFHTNPVSGGRLGDFAGRHGDTIEEMEVTREGGIAVIVGGSRLRAHYLAPEQTRRPLVALRDARTSGRRVRVTADTTRPGTLRLEVRRAGKVVALARRPVKAGRQELSVDGRFAPAVHDVRVSLRTPGGGRLGEAVSLFTGTKLPMDLVTSGLDDLADGCDRQSTRRVDCEVHYPEDEEDGPCLNTRAYRLAPSGALFVRSYGPPCHPKPMPFERDPEWTGPWTAWLPR